LLATISYLSSPKNIKSMVTLLPLIAAILFESHIRYLSLRIDSPSTYLTVNLQLIFECIPLLIAHWMASQHSLKQASLWWLSGFIGYPILTYLLSNSLPTYDKWHYLQEQCWLLCSLASLLWLSSQRFKKNQNSKLTSWISSLFTLNKVVFVICFGWAFVMAGILNSHEAPLLNQPFALIFDTEKLLTNFYQFIWYFSQLLVYAIIVHGIFLFNRYILIRQLLARYGVLIFVSACLISMVIFTPLFVAIVLTLPVNDIPSYVANLTPGGNQDIINKYNYQFMFLFLSISTPIILAFERQQHHHKLEEVAKQQIRTELKLLQQQINPHFLFNTLNNLYALALTKSEKTPELVLQLADLLRYTVYEGQKPFVPLEKELNYIKNFLELHKIRHANNCRFNLAWPETSHSLSIAPLLLIILIENTIKYGVEQAKENAEVTIKLTLNDNVLTLFCENSIPRKSDNADSGMGLNNLKRRLELLYPERHTLVVRNHNGLWQTALSLELSND